MKIQTSELTDIALTWAVATCEGTSVVIETIAEQTERFRNVFLVDGNKPPQEAVDAVIAGIKPRLRVEGSHGIHLVPVPKYPTDWAQGGPIIEREGINLRAIRKEGHALDGQWLAAYDHGNTGGLVHWVKRTDFPKHYFLGTKSLIAAMRCHVASKLGDEVDIPKELEACSA